MATRRVSVAVALVVAASTLYVDTAAQAQDQNSAIDTPAPDNRAPVTTFRQFGAWLDDASAMFPGDGYLGVGVSQWRVFNITQTSAPMVSGGLGLTDRFQVGAFIPFSRLTLHQRKKRTVDDVYLSAKYNILDPALTLGQFGLAVSPVVEILSADVPGDRIHFAIPISAEIRRAPMRLYGSVGYFTRGALFSGGALEWRVARRLILTGAVTQSYSAKHDRGLDQLSVGRQRVDAAATVVCPVANRTAVYASVGRSLSSFAEGGTKLALVGGVAMGFSTGMFRR